MVALAVALVVGLGATAPAFGETAAQVAQRHARTAAASPAGRAATARLEAAARDQARREASARAANERAHAQSALNRQWSDARSRAASLHLGDVVSRRALALLVGGAWLWLLARRRIRRGRASRRYA